LVQIYMDESGSFVQPQRAFRISAVGALVVPDRQADALFRAFEELTRPWARDGREVKGSALSEIQIAGVIELVGRYECLFDIRGIDMGMHDLERIQTFQDRQATAITAEITEAHHESWREWGATTETRMRALSPQLFTQGMVTIFLVLDLIQAATLYYVQRLPEELVEFHWRVDPKDPTRRTELEMLWTDVILPMAQTQSIKQPFITVEGCDYSYFERYYVEREDMPSGLAEHVGDSPGAGGLALKEILADLTFPESHDETGLRIVDVLLSAFCRALNGTLEKRGWAMLGRLMTATMGGRSRLVFLRKEGTEQQPRGGRRYDTTLAAIERHTQDIFTRGRRRK
jgi:hypothetical protein